MEVNNDDIQSLFFCVSSW